mgnify:CR=1 FL=1
MALVWLYDIAAVTVELLKEDAEVNEEIMVLFAITATGMMVTVVEFKKGTRVGRVVLLVAFAAGRMAQVDVTLARTGGSVTAGALVVVFKRIEKDVLVFEAIDVVGSGSKTVIVSR